VIDRRGLCRAVALAIPSLAGCSLPGRDGGTATPAALSVLAVRAPSSAAVGDRFEYAVTVRNAGASPASLDTAVEARGTDGAWRPVGRLSVELPPGDRVTRTARLWPRAVGGRTYRLAATGTTWRVTVGPARRPFGGRVRTPDGVAVVVERPRPAPDATARLRTRTGTDADAATDAPARRVVRLFVDTRNVANGPRRSPDPWEFRAETDGGPAVPVEGLTRPYRAARFGPGVERSGWLGFAVPAGVEPAALSVVWSETNAHGRAVARWGSDATPAATPARPVGRTGYQSG
jgi:hypothetical protein